MNFMGNVLNVWGIAYVYTGGGTDAEKTFAFYRRSGFIGRIVGADIG